jgi:hypothetical protein
MKYETSKNRLFMTTRILIALIAMTIVYGCTGRKAVNNGKPADSKRVEFSREFAPSDGLVRGPETAVRNEICLNGRWDFQPVYGPYDNKKTTPYGMEASEVAPDLTEPVSTGWDSVRVKVPSSWTSNEEFLSYPAKWRQARMGWMRKNFRVPADWSDKRIILQFQAVGGDCKVLVNGKKTGGNFDSTTPFGFDITDKILKGSDNEVTLGIRSNSFFNRQGSYGKITYPPGGGRNIGIWQDVYLLALPDIYISNVFIKPLVSENILYAEITIHNSTSEDQTVNVDAGINDWINLAGTDMIEAPEVKWKLGNEVLKIAPADVTIKAGQDKVVILKTKTGGILKYWDFENPNLYGLTANLEKNGKTIDRKYERFGWREFRIVGKDMTLNGKKIKFLGDSQHLQNTTFMTRRFAWSWYKLLKDAGANAVRFHALVWPEYMSDVADEMGIAVLPESSLYASSCDINYDSEMFWKSAAHNINGMVMKFRNHPSVYGWSIENESLPALNVKCNDPKYKQMVYDGMNFLADICRTKDPTRNWISGDGSLDMDGRLPVCNVHYSSIDNYKEVAAVTDKPFCVGEEGIAWYGTPRQYEKYVGDRAYRSYKDFSDGVAVEIYEFLRAQREICTYCSIWNIGFYGVEQLPLGKSDLSKPATRDEGIFLTAEYKEGKPGVQPERIPPYSTQYNPGYDPGLPLYRPLSSFFAAKAGYQPVPLACEWDHRLVSEIPPAPVIINPEKEVLFCGDPDSDMYARLRSIGIPAVMNQTGSKIVIIDCSSVDVNDDLKATISNTVKQGGTVIFWGLAPANRNKVAPLIPCQFELFERSATSLIKNEKDFRVASIPYRDLYFSDISGSKVIMKYALKGSIADKGNILLKACPADWSKGNNGGMLRSERENPEGPSFVEIKEGKGSYIASTIELPVVTPAHSRMLSQLFRNLGVAVKQVDVKKGSILDQTAAISRTLIGYYNAENSEEAFNKDFIGGETKVKPAFGTNSNGSAWNVEESVAGIFNFNKPGPENELRRSGAVYLSFWFRSPKSVSDIEPVRDSSDLSLKFSVAGSCKIWLNGQEEYRSTLSGENIILRKLPLVAGWNHILIKVVRISSEWSFAGRFVSDDPEFLSSLTPALNPYSEKADFVIVKHTDPDIAYDRSWWLQYDGWYECSAPGSKAVIKFSGTGICLTGLVWPKGGKAKIYVDGKFDKIVDYKNNLRDPKSKYYIKSGLIDGEHEIIVEVIGGCVSVGPYEQWVSYK